jgi:hypothetical protein
MGPVFWISLGIVCAALGRAIDTLWESSRSQGRLQEFNDLPPDPWSRRL